MIEGKMPAGTIVGCRYRWPMCDAHPDCWQPPHKGEVLALDDPRAWRNTIKFPDQLPSQEETTDHVLWCLSKNLVDIKVPVLYTTESHEQFMQWDNVEKLLPYEQELAAWQIARDRQSKGQMENYSGRLCHSA